MEFGRTFFHALKFRNNKIPSKEYDFYKTFTLRSNSPWCKDPFLAKQAGRVSDKTGKIFDKKIGDSKIPKDIKMRHDFYEAKIPSKLQKLGFFCKIYAKFRLEKCFIIYKRSRVVALYWKN